MREELEELINYEMTDPRVGTANVVEVKLSPDLRQAHVLLALRGTPQEQADTLAAVNHANQFLKHQLTERLQLYRTPELHFEAALSATLGVKSNQVLRRIRRGRPKNSAD
jgi:ribosome-binding factor A